MSLRKYVGMLVGLVTLLAVGWGCASTPPPKELVDARANFERAKKGLAPELAPADLDTAKQALAKAEDAFKEEPKGQTAKDLAYIADRKAQLAEANAAIERAERTRKGADKNYKETTESELAKARQQVTFGQQALAGTQQALADEQKARQEAERRAKAAMDSLAQVAAVKEEARGVVITLSGAVMFASGKSTLLPIARDKLDQVAKSIKDQGGSPTLVVEGHTDTTGPRWQNMQLSQQRADAVREYLVSRGIPSDKITAIGIGPDRPVVDNATPDGRANNRRVEIIVK
jgi:outer membrane protein OmpA-like peptidoglycan-associated protein